MNYSSMLTRNAIRGELNYRMELAVKYTNLIKTAKTGTKRKYYQKKLVATNNIAADLLLSLDRLSADTSSNPASDPGTNANV